MNFNAANFAGNDTARCGGIATDVDNDNLTVNITFRVNGTLLNSSIFPSVLNGSFINVTLSNTALYNRSDRVNCTLQVNDSDATPIWGSNQTVIRNAEPSLIGGVNLTGDDGGLNRTNANLTLAFGCTDSDAGDSCNATQRITWWLGQANRTALDNLTVAHMGNTTRGDVWLAGVQTSDGWNASSLTAFVNASNISIQNTPPAAVVLTQPDNRSNVTGTSVIFGWNASADADADPVNYTWWLDRGDHHGSITDTSFTFDTAAGFHNWSVMASDATDDTANSTFAFFQEGGGPGPGGGGGGASVGDGSALDVPPPEKPKLQELTLTYWQKVKAWLKSFASEGEPMMVLDDGVLAVSGDALPPLPDALQGLTWYAWFGLIAAALLIGYIVWQQIVLGLIVPGVMKTGGWGVLLVTVIIALLIAKLAGG